MRRRLRAYLYVLGLLAGLVSLGVGVSWAAANYPRLFAVAAGAVFVAGMVELMLSGEEDF